MVSGANYHLIHCVVALFPEGVSPTPEFLIKDIPRMQQLNFDAIGCLLRAQSELGAASQSTISKKKPPQAGDIDFGGEAGIRTL